ncbi:hypothetical protein GCM10023176_62420 [Micromonospora coerulea]|uniref:Uncharacterized protein n=1 Tax=Micromonospora coerulea TaxID=47856 RepID=A0ABP8T8Y9_9ACTN
MTRGCLYLAIALVVLAPACDAVGKLHWSLFYRPPMRLTMVGAGRALVLLLFTMALAYLLG